MIEELWLASDEAKEERATWRVIVTKALIFIGLMLCLAIIFGCAEDRYWTKEEDAQAREICTEGCALVPLPVWRQIKKALGITGT